MHLSKSLKGSMNMQPRRGINYGQVDIFIGLVRERVRIGPSITMATPLSRVMLVPSVDPGTPPLGDMTYALGT
jgi:hypothetical protein